MSDERQNATDELKQWRILYKEFLAPNETESALQIEQCLRGDSVEGKLGARPVNYPLEADEEDYPNLFV